MTTIIESPISPVFEGCIEERLVIDDTTRNSDNVSAINHSVAVVSESALSRPLEVARQYFARQAFWKNYVVGDKRETSYNRLEKISPAVIALFPESVYETYDHLSDSDQRTIVEGALGALGLTVEPLTALRRQSRQKRLTSFVLDKAVTLQNKAFTILETSREKAATLREYAIETRERRTVASVTAIAIVGATAVGALLWSHKTGQHVTGLHSSYTPPSTPSTQHVAVLTGQVAPKVPSSPLPRIGASTQLQEFIPAPKTFDADPTSNIIPKHSTVTVPRVKAITVPKLGHGITPETKVIAPRIILRQGETAWGALKHAGIKDPMASLEAAAKTSGLPYKLIGTGTQRYIEVAGKSDAPSVLKMLTKFIKV